MEGEAALARFPIFLLSSLYAGQANLPICAGPQKLLFYLCEAKERSARLDLICFSSRAVWLFVC
jgi:hypothetical protein